MASSSSSSNSGSSSGSNDYYQADYPIWVLELYEIGNQIQIAQTQMRNHLTSKLGVPSLYQQDEYHAVMVQLDAGLERWEVGVRREWGVWDGRQGRRDGVDGRVVDRGVRVERYLLRLR